MISLIPGSVPGSVFSMLSETSCPELNPGSGVSDGSGSSDGSSAELFQSSSPELISIFISSPEDSVPPEVSPDVF